MEDFMLGFAMLGILLLCVKILWAWIEDS